MDATWRALADPTRRRLIELLRDGPRTTGELCRAFSTTRFAVMKHLAILERGGLVSVRREGRVRWNSLNVKELSAVSGRWAGPRTGPASSTAAGEAAVDRAVSEPGVGAPACQVFVDGVAWRVFDALTVNVSAWWGAPHLRSVEATNLVLDARPGGHFYEEWGHRQGALLGWVVAIRQDERLELAGPLCGESADSRLAMTLEAREGGTLLTVVSRGVPAAVVEDLFRVRLKAFVERGERTGIAR